MDIKWEYKLKPDISNDDIAACLVKFCLHWPAGTTESAYSYMYKFTYQENIQRIE